MKLKKITLKEDEFSLLFFLCEKSLEFISPEIIRRALDEQAIDELMTFEMAQMGKDEIPKHFEEAVDSWADTDPETDDEEYYASQMFQFAKAEKDKDEKVRQLVAIAVLKNKTPQILAIREIAEMILKKEIQ